MQSRSPSQWQSRRKPSLGKLRRAHPASGATWNVQVVRGKMTSKCLWHACRALVLGMVLMLLGAGMATIGYYADHLSIGSEIRGNATVRVKNESRGFHLNNLSYVGPIVMGFGGFIVVAACVMTFEARDSAAKVVPARFKAACNSRMNVRGSGGSGASGRRDIMLQSTRWDHHLGVFRTSPAEPSQQSAPLDREAMTAALIHFSKTLGNSPRQSPETRHVSRSGSVPNLASNSGANSAKISPSYRKKLIMDQSSHHHHHQHHHHSHGHGGGHHQGRHLPNHRTNRVSSSLINRSSRESANSLLHPAMLQYHRHALSVDETGPYFKSIGTPNDSQASIIYAADSHEGRMRDRTFRSDTSKRHVLARQKPIEKEEPHSPKTGYTNGRRRSSTASEASLASRGPYRRTSSASRTPSIDSRSVQVELHSPEKNRPSPRTPRRFNSGQSSTPSVEREFRSQLSICSEPIAVRQLSGQSSLDPYVLEESPELEDKEPSVDNSPPLQSPNSIEMKSPLDKNGDIDDSTCSLLQAKKSRPNSLVIDASNENAKSSKAIAAKKYLYRSRSSRTFYRPKPRLINEYDPIYFISTDGSIRKRPYDKDEELYDSLQVINERRSKILTTTSTTAADAVIESSFELQPAPFDATATNTLPTTTTEFSKDNKSLELIGDISLEAKTTTNKFQPDENVLSPIATGDDGLINNTIPPENDKNLRNNEMGTLAEVTTTRLGAALPQESRDSNHQACDTRITLEPSDAES